LLDVLFLTVFNKPLERIRDGLVNACLLNGVLVVHVLVDHKLQKGNVVKKAFERGLAYHSCDILEKVEVTKDLVQVINLAFVSEDMLDLWNCLLKVVFGGGRPLGVAGVFLGPHKPLELLF